MPYLETPPGLFGYKGTDTTGLEAAEKARSNAWLRQTILETIARFTVAGATPDEVAKFLNLDILSVRPRFSELRNEGKIEPTGRRRKTGRGGNAAVMRVRSAPQDSPPSDDRRDNPADAGTGTREAPLTGGGETTASKGGH